tara:strand:+ start:117 stop:524 length:408 start_codon:yes stop_codon:yes gene_type:complete
MDLANTATLKKINRRIAEALAEVENEFDLDFKTGTFRYSPDGDSFDFKMEATARGAETREEKDFKETFALDFSAVKPEHLGKVFDASGGKRFKVTGFKTRSRKNKIALMDIDSGREMHCPIKTLEMWVTTGREVK